MHLDPTVFFLFLLLTRNGVGTIGFVDRNAEAARDKSDDGVARKRVAATGKADLTIVDPVDNDSLI